MKSFIKKNREMILYMAFGTLTVLVNFVTYFVMSQINDNTAVDTAVALLASIIVAYATNRTMVFKSEHHGAKAIFLEFFSFAACRLISGFMDIIIMVIFVDFFHYNDLLIKLISNAFVIIFNYTVSKWFIFKR